MNVAANQVIPLHSAQPQVLKDFWEVYDAHFEEVMAGAMSLLAGDPGLAAIQTPGPVEQEAKSQKVRHLLRRAVVDGDWEPYWGDLRAQGSTYARIGLSFSAWLRIVGAIRTVLTPHLVHAYGKTPDRLLGTIDAMNGLMDQAMAVIGEEYLNTKEKIILQQQDALRELSTPVLQVRDKMLLLPIIGVVDSHRAHQLTEQLLRSIRANRARVVVVDITGVPAVDSRVAYHLVQTVEAARLMGARAIVTGLSAEVAQTLVTLGVELGKLNTVGDLQGGFEEGERLVGYKVIGAAPPKGEVKGRESGLAGPYPQAG